MSSTGPGPRARSGCLLRSSRNNLVVENVSYLGGGLYGATTFVFGLIWVGYLKITGQPLLIKRTGLLYSFAVGLAFSLVTMLLYLTFARVSVSIGSPTIRLTGILIASLLGLLVLHEPITWRYVLGVILAIKGVTLIVLR